ncbi:MAG: hypothetical protein HWE34_02085 [Methylocystaceae bacterium]|nr:hypothetical protein [Methylocystaceae bacterium]
MIGQIKKKRPHSSTLTNTKWRKLERQKCKKRLKQSLCGKQILSAIQKCNSRCACNIFYCRKCYRRFLNQQIRVARKALQNQSHQNVATFTILISHLAFQANEIDKSWEGFRRDMRTIFRNNIPEGKLLCWQELDHYDQRARESFYKQEAESKHFQFLSSIGQLDVDVHHSVLLHVHGILIAPNLDNAIRTLKHRFSAPNQTKFKYNYKRKNIFQELSGWVRYSTKNSPRYYRKGKVHFGPILNHSDLLHFIEFLHERTAGSRRLTIGLNES